MTTYLSLIRGINVGPHKTVKMEDLVAIYKSRGLDNVRTYLRSGNVLFDSGADNPLELATMLGDSITRGLGFAVQVIIRTGDELQHVVTITHFYRERTMTPGPCMSHSSPVSPLNDPSGK